MSGAHKALTGSRAPAVAPADTTVAVWGKAGNLQLATGWKYSDRLFLYAPTPVGSLLRGATSLAMGYGMGVATFTDGRMETWGLNNSAVAPSGTGPGGYWCGTWTYRQNLLAQVKLESEGKTRAQVEALDQSFAYPPRAEDGLPALPGQVVFLTGHVVRWEGISYRAKAMNCGRRPDLYPAIWEKTSPQIVEFQKPTNDNPDIKVWYPYAFNLCAPAPAPTMKEVLAASMIGSKGLVLLTGGRVREFGRMTNYGSGGNGFNSTYGPKKRPLRPPPKKTNAFHGRLQAGSRWVDQLEGVGEKHHKTQPEIGLLSGALAEGSNRTTLPVEAWTRTLPAGANITVEDAKKHKQTWTLTAEAAAGASSISVVSQEPNFTYAAGSKVKLGVPLTTSFGQATKVGGVVLAPTVIQMTSDKAGAAVSTIGCAIGLVSITAQPEEGTATLEASGGEATILRVTGAPAKTKVSVGVRIAVLGVLNGALRSPITAAGGGLTVLPLEGFTLPMKAGETVLLDDGAGHTQAWVLATDAPAGTSELRVELLTPAFTFPAHTTKVRKESTIVSTDTELGVESLTGTLNGTLTSALSLAGAPEVPLVSLLKVSGVTALMKAGAPLVLDDGAGHTQVWELASDLAIAATEAHVEPQRPTFAFPATTTKVRIAVAYEPERRRVLRIQLSEAALANYGGVAGEASRLRTKKAPKEQVYGPVAEGAAQSAAWSVEPQLPPGVKASAVCCSTNGGLYPFMLVLTTAGKVLAWGSNINGQQGRTTRTTGGALPTGGEAIQTAPAYVRNPTDTGDLENIVAVAAGETFWLALASNGDVYITGSVDKGMGGKASDIAEEIKTQLPKLIPEFTTLRGEGKGAVALAGGEHTGYALCEDAKVRAWGFNSSGQGAVGEVAGKDQKRWKSGSGTYAVNAKVYDRGFNWKCIVAVSGSTTHPESDATHWERREHPVVVTPTDIGLTGCTFLSSGREHFAVVAAGAVYTCGANGFGQIGNGSSGKGDGAPDVGTPYKVNLEGKVATAVECSEWNTLAILEGGTPVFSPAKFTLLPEGEVQGEQAARLRVEWKSGIATGWQLRVARQASWWEEAEVQSAIEAVEAELESGELTGEEETESEAELEELEEAQNELEKGKGSFLSEAEFNAHITEPSPGTFRFDWTPPTVMTKNLSYVVTLSNPEAEPTNWREVVTFTNGLFLSPYAI